LCHYDIFVIMNLVGTALPAHGCPESSGANSCARSDDAGAAICHIGIADNPDIALTMADAFREMGASRAGGDHRFEPRGGAARVAMVNPTRAGAANT